MGRLLSAGQRAVQQLTRLGVAWQQQHQNKQQQGGAGTASAAAATAGAAAAGLPFDPPAQAYGGPCGRQYSYEDLHRATSGFHQNNFLGQGGYGAVYRGTLDGIPVAMKVMDRSVGAMQGTKEFSQEVTILSRLHHPHILMLIGSCPEQGILVYELMENGSLDQALFPQQQQQQQQQQQRPPLRWQDRVRIAAEVASALLFLHSAPEPIVHMDLKPANVLLSNTLTSKLGDVGLARLLKQPVGAAAAAKDSRLVGTLGYLDPEYMRTGVASPQSDLYALGVVMLQMLTGIENSTVVDVVQTARRDVLRFPQILDARAGQWPAAEAVAFADVALKCVALRRQDRPDLRGEVLPSLAQLKQRTQLYPAAAAPSTAPPGPTGLTQQPAGSSGPDDPPHIFICPITQDVMEEPVVAADGYMYEKDAIEEWLTRSPTSPLTNMPMPHTHLTPNHALRSAIMEWRERMRRQQRQGR